MPEQRPDEQVLLVRSRAGGDEVDAELHAVTDVPGRVITVVDPDAADAALRAGGWDAVVLRWTGDRALVYRAGGLVPRPGVLAVVEQLPAADLRQMFESGVDDVVPLPLDAWEIERVLPQVVAVGFAQQAARTRRPMPAVADEQLVGDWAVLAGRDDAAVTPDPVLSTTPVWPPPESDEAHEPAPDAVGPEPADELSRLPTDGSSTDEEQRGR